MLKFKIIIVLFIYVFSLVVCDAIYATNSVTEDFDLKSIAGYNVASISYIDLNSDEVATSIMSDLLSELRPYLKDIIDENTDGDNNFSSSEVIKIIAGHPIKFITAIYNYAANSIKEVFIIAEDNATIVEN